MYGNIKNNIENTVILASHNEDIDKLNSKILNMMNGKLITIVLIMQHKKE